MLSINNFVQKDTILHKCHPVIKFLTFLLVIFLLFLRNSLFIHLSILGFTAWAIIASKNFKFLYRKMCFILFVLFIFLLFVNWLFNKSPGFWSHNNLTENYYEIFGNSHVASEANLSGHLNTATTSGGSAQTTDTIYNGWFMGGEIVKQTGKTHAAYASSPDCIRKIAGVITDSSISDCSTNNAYSGLNPRHLKIFTTLNSAGEQIYVGFFTKWYTITAMQFIFALNMATKLIVVITLSSILSITTPTSDLAYALEDIFKPLKLIRLPAQEMSLIVALALRFVPSLLEESFRIIKAQASRGIDFKNGQLRDKLMSILALFIPLFVISFIKSDELSSALIARGYKPKKPKSSYKVHNVSFVEYIVFIVLVISISILYTFSFKNGYAKIFGQIEFILLMA